MPSAQANYLLDLSTINSMRSYTEMLNSTITTITITRSDPTQGINFVQFGMFNRCSNLTTVTIGEGVEEIRPYAFYKCSNLTSVTLPHSLKTIGDAAFRDCPLLININLEELENLESIGFRAFYGDNIAKYANRTLKILNADGTFCDYDGVVTLDDVNPTTSSAGITYCASATDLFNVRGGKIDQDYSIRKVDVFSSDVINAPIGHQQTQPSWLKFTKKVATSTRRYDTLKDLFGGD